MQYSIVKTTKKNNIKIQKSIAVLIPTYCPDSYIFKCLESLDRQTIDRSCFHVYVCLNGEREPYLSNLLIGLRDFSFYSDLIFTPTSGVSNARNILLDYSDEDFIVFVDDDDMVSSVYLEELLGVTTDTSMGVSKCLSFASYSADFVENFLTAEYDRIVAGERSKTRARKYFSSPWAKMIHRKMIGSHRFDVKVRKGEDSLFFALISPEVNSLSKTSKEACYLVNERLGSLSRTRTFMSTELRTLGYLAGQYLRLLFKPNYNQFFILTRLSATLIKFWRLLFSR
jgi:glycosyltransferase involved in cell wall biosynthesis